MCSQFLTVSRRHRVNLIVECLYCILNFFLEVFPCKLLALALIAITKFIFCVVAVKRVTDKRCKVGQGDCGTQCYKSFCASYSLDYFLQLFVFSCQYVSNIPMDTLQLVVTIIQLYGYYAYLGNLGICGIVLETFQ